MRHVVGRRPNRVQLNSNRVKVGIGKIISLLTESQYAIHDLPLKAEKAG